MKRFFLQFLIGIIIFTGVSNAQAIRGVGIKVGMTISNQDWEYSLLSIEPDSRTGFNIGLFAELFDLPVFSVVTELNYVQKGITNLGGFIGESILDGDLRLNYLNISALAKLRMNFVTFSPYIVAGPKLDIELSREASLPNLILNNLNKEKVGFKVGLGTELNFTGVDLLVELLYDGDFNELYQENDLIINASAFDIRVGILF